MTVRYPWLPLVALAHSSQDPHLCAALHSSGTKQGPWAVAARHWADSADAPLGPLLKRVARQQHLGAAEAGAQQPLPASVHVAVVRHVVESLVMGEGPKGLVRRLAGEGVVVRREDAAKLAAGFVECFQGVAEHRSRLLDQVVQQHGG